MNISSHASLACLIVFLPSMASAQIQNLGAPPSGSFRATLVSADGSVVAGYAEHPIDGARPGVWTEDGGLRLLSAGSSMEFAPFGLSGDGSVLVGARINGSLLGVEAAVWSVATDQRIDLGFLPGDAASAAQYVSDDGAVVVGRSNGGSQGRRVFRWQAASGLQDIGSLSPGQGTDTNAFDMTPDGSVIVGASRGPVTESRAFVWSESTGITAVPGLGPHTSAAYGVSRDGRAIVGWTLNPAIPSQAFYYFEGLGPIEIQLDGGRLLGGPGIKISDDGWSVTGSARMPNGDMRGFTWTLGGGPHFMDDSFDLRPSSISEDGTVVVGAVQPESSSGQLRAFRWDASALGGSLRVLNPLRNGRPNRAAELSRDGSIVVGFGTARSGESEGALWRATGVIGQSYCGPAVVNSSGFPAATFLGGTNTISQGQLTLRATSLPPGATGFFLVSDAPGFTFPVTSSQGALCLSGSIGRFVAPGQIQAANFFGEIAIAVDPGNLPSPQGGFAATPGQSLYFQAWFRDANPTSTSNFSSGATVRFY